MFSVFYQETITQIGTKCYKYFDFLNSLYLEDNESDYHIYSKDFNRYLY